MKYWTEVGEADLVKDKIDGCFWETLEQLVREAVLVIDRPKGTHHPRYSDIVYGVDYGYLQDTSSMDGGGIDVWKGTADPAELDAIMCTVDLKKKDSEIKLLIGCTEEEKSWIEWFHNNSQWMKGVMMRRTGN